MTQDPEPAAQDSPHWHLEITAAVHGAAAIATGAERPAAAADAATAEAVRELRGALDYTLRLRGPLELTAPGPDRLRLHLTVAAPSLIAAIRDATDGVVVSLVSLMAADLRPGELVAITGRAPGEPAPAA